MAEKQSIRESSNRQEESLKEQLLHGKGDKYGIYQLKDNPETVRLHFRGTESLKEAGILKDEAEAVAVKPENYDLVYAGDLSELAAKTAGLDTQEDILHALFEIFNIYRPEDFTGHSLSVSDIIVLHENGKNTAHYVDSTGYTEMPHFIQGLEMRGKEQECQKTDPVQPEGRQKRHGSLRETLEECKELSAKEGKGHPAKEQKKEPLL